MKNIRKLERYSLKAPAKIIPIDSGRNQTAFDLTTSNICAGGAFFHTSQPLPTGTNVKIDLILPLDRLKKLNNDCPQAYIKVTGTVLRSESTGMAIHFHEDYHIRPWRRQ